MAQPSWWEWELELTPHLEKRMEDRDFTEVDLRRMFAGATDVRPGTVDGRFVVETSHRGGPWHIIVEPDDELRCIVVVPPTAWRSEMKRPYLEITFRRGKPMAAYLYLPRPAGARSARTVEARPHVLIDYAVSGEPIGLELTAPAQTQANVINEILRELGLDALDPADLSPLAA